MNRSLSPSSLALRFSPWMIALLAAAILTSACTTTRVGNDFDRSARFASYHTYAWMPRDHGNGRNPLAVRFAREAIEAALDRKGFVLVNDPASADFEVDFTIGARDRLDINSYPVGYRGPWNWGRWYYGDQIDVRKYRQGTLAVDIFDGKTHQPVWTGWATKELSHADQTRSDEPIRLAVAAVLAEFPPQPSLEAKLQ